MKAFSEQNYLLWIHSIFFDEGSQKLQKLAFHGCILNDVAEVRLSGKRNQRMQDSVFRLKLQQYGGEGDSMVLSGAHHVCVFSSLQPVGDDHTRPCGEHEPPDVAQF